MPCTVKVLQRYAASGKALIMLRHDFKVGKGSENWITFSNGLIFYCSNATINDAR